MNNIATVVIALVLYIVLAPVFGGLLAGIDRKVTARMQGRYGPPILQPFYDVFKLLEKEPITVNKGQDFYAMCFLIFMIITGCLFFSGQDILLVIFVLTLSSAFLVIGAYVSNSPYAQAGAERELLSMMAYEPMVLMTAVGFYLFSGSFRVDEIIGLALPPVVLLPGVFLGFAYILTIKFRKSPFDLSMSHHAHQELVKGLTTEFSGKTLALIEIAHWYENIFLLGLVYIFFAWNSPLSFAVGLIAVVVVYFIEIFIDNNYARMKWQFALKSSWVVALTLGFVNLLVLYYMN